MKLYFLIGLLALVLTACNHVSTEAPIVVTQEFNLTAEMSKEGYTLQCINWTTVEMTNLSTTGMCIKHCLGLDSFCAVGCDEVGDNDSRCEKYTYYFCSGMTERVKVFNNECINHCAGYWNESICTVQAWVKINETEQRCEAESWRDECKGRAEK